MTALLSFWLVIFFTLLFHHNKQLTRSLTLLIIFFIVFLFDFFLKNLPDQAALKNLYDLLRISDFGYPLYNTPDIGMSGLESAFATKLILFNNFFSYQFTHSLTAALLAYAMLYVIGLLVEDKYFSIISIFFISIYFINYVLISQRFGIIIFFNMLSIHLIQKKKYALGFLSSASAHLFHFAGIILIPLYFIYLIFQKFRNIYLFLISFFILLIIFLVIIFDVNILNLISESVFIKVGYFKKNESLSLLYIIFFLLFFLFGLHRLEYSQIFSLNSPFLGVLFILLLIPFYNYGTLVGRLFALFTTIPFIFSIRNILKNIDNNFRKINFIYPIFGFFSFLFYYRLIQNKYYLQWAAFE